MSNFYLTLGQFPTLGFVVERYLKKKIFEIEEFWFIYCSYKEIESFAEFKWRRYRFFDRLR
jgi:DNA topoisomerase III